MNEVELEQRIQDLRVLEGAQKLAIRRRLAQEEPVPTSDINGLAQLAVRIDALERILDHRRSRAGKAPPRRQTRRGSRTST